MGSVTTIAVDSGLFTSKKTNHKEDGSALVPKLMMRGLLLWPDTTFRILVPETVVAEVANWEGKDEPLFADGDDLAALLDEFRPPPGLPPPGTGDEGVVSAMLGGRSVVEVVPAVALSELEARAHALAAVHGHEWEAATQRTLFTDGAFCDNDAVIVETAWAARVPLLTINKKMAYQTNPGPRSLRWHLWQDDAAHRLRLVILDNRFIDSVDHLAAILVDAGAGRNIPDPLDYVVSLRALRVAAEPDPNVILPETAAIAADIVAAAAPPLLATVAATILPDPPAPLSKKARNALTKRLLNAYRAAATTAVLGPDVSVHDVVAPPQVRHALRIIIDALRPPVLALVSSVF